MKLLLLLPLVFSCSSFLKKEELPRREKDREAMIDCAKRLYDAGMSEEGVRGICNDALGRMK